MRVQSGADKSTVDLPAGADSLELESFQPATYEGTPNAYRAGDYWLIPARTATGDVECLGEVGQTEARPPHSVEHHYAPLAVVDPANYPPEIDCRCTFYPSCYYSLDR